ncbi:MAG: helix-turn-helix transcriptional regulator [Symploca sp. SIO2B6]|nr:helix-turn-helix transcriptional regulator [Symploca sp. SIO2B6]
MTTTQGNLLFANTKAQGIYPKNTRQNPQLPTALQDLIITLKTTQFSLLEENPLLTITSTGIGNHGQLLHLTTRYFSFESDITTIPEDQRHILITIEDLAVCQQHILSAEVQHYRLTPRETEIYTLRSQRQSYKDIAKALFISINTVKRHCKSIKFKQHDVNWYEAHNLKEYSPCIGQRLANGYALQTPLKKRHPICKTHLF